LSCSDILEGNDVHEQGRVFFERTSAGEILSRKRSILIWRASPQERLDRKKEGKGKGGGVDQKEKEGKSLLEESIKNKVEEVERKRGKGRGSQHHREKKVGDPRVGTGKKRGEH